MTHHSSLSREVTAICRAKINLTLDVLGRRADGYHDIASVMQSIELADTLRVRATAETGVEITCDCPDVPTGKGNTVRTACDLFLKAAGIESGVAVSIEKRIPLQAGLGGGSSDAAGAFLSLNHLFGSPLSESDLARLAATVGSDVTFFLGGGTAIVSGRGDVIEKLPDAPALELVVVKPDFGVCTTWAYRRLDEVEGRRPGQSTAVVADAIRRDDRAAIIAGLSNDFESITSTAFPQIAAIEREMAELGAEAALLCGSGACVFGIFRGLDEALRACEVFDSIYPFAAAVKTSPVAVTLDWVTTHVG